MHNNFILNDFFRFFIFLFILREEASKFYRYLT